MRWGLLLALTSFVVAQEAKPIPEWDEEDRENRRSGWRVLDYEPFVVAPRGGEVDAEAEALIDGLVNLAEPRSGLTCRSSGGIHLTLTDDPFGRLVRMGPAALPSLLHHLEDPRPTKLSFSGNHDGPLLGRMMASCELRVPRGRVDEESRIREAFGGGVATSWTDPDGLDRERRLSEHVVTVGDCCLVILGQIVNRPYEAVSCQPSVIYAVCSPTHDPRVAEAVRAAWGYADPHQLLAASLQRDFYTRGDNSDGLQAGAAARLCLWYPDEAGSTVARQVALLDLEGGGAYFAKMYLREVLKADCAQVRDAWWAYLDPARPDGVVLAALEALRHPPDEQSLRRIRNIYAETENAAIMLECLRWIAATGPEVLRRLEASLWREAGRGVRGYRYCCYLIREIARRDPTRAREICTQYMKRGHGPKLVVLGALFWAEELDLVVDLMTPLLEDQAPLGHMAGIPVPGPISGHERNQRVCDYAAAALLRSRGGREFPVVATEQARDEAIAQLRRTLEQK